MRIAVFHNLPSGGAKRALYDCVKYLTELKINVDVFVPSTADEKFLPLSDVANVYVYNVKQTLISPILSFAKYNVPIKNLFELEKTEKYIAETINKKNYDAVLCEQDRYTMSPFILKYLKKPTVYYCQQPLRITEAIIRKITDRMYSHKYKSSRTLIKFLRYIYGIKMTKIDLENALHSKYMVCNSYFSRESILRRYGINSYVSYLGVNTELFRPIETSDDEFILTVGSLTPAKGFDFIIRSINYINKKNRPKLIIVSNFINTKWKEYIEYLARKLEVNIEIKVMVDNNELVKLYNKAKLVVYAPYLEPFGLVPLEAMACGTPVIAVKEGGVRESVVHKETGLLVDRDEEIFAEAIISLLTDDERREKMREKCIKVVNDFWTIEHAGERLLNHIYRSIERYRR